MSNLTNRKKIILPINQFILIIVYINLKNVFTSNTSLLLLLCSPLNLRIKYKKLNSSIKNYSLKEPCIKLHIDIIYSLQNKYFKMNNNTFQSKSDIV